MEDTSQIKKINWVELVLSYLVHRIEKFKTRKQSGICGCLLFFMVISLYIIYLIVNLEFVIKKLGKLTICPSKLYLQLFYHEHISLQQNFPPLSTRPFP